MLECIKRLIRCFFNEESIKKDNEYTSFKYQSEGNKFINNNQL